mmetsp:Transcript_51889/g.105644  ORF Transcript_51889/g.105644 Transcript_51889/m.105644 type:complete len:411 (-) Transcript_51889:125-1357(-)|eukprot:CAMPEP_0181320404 /NCGR_PEP_ID=MMETSP1101-20121128/18107_1 /TAXON_ID=46948 /ORGANISM="Rhodomonas abbreviata, Strain Caron Lab Isolate" /LENGTH=410 /DNA_ID=CAMNT_0023428109 /DNA_START=70 /DNA_END=1302 /DNA_ORIENTATION=-
MDQAGIYHTGIAKGTHHKGPRTAGNKSLISFRAGHGVVGYVGYTPSWESIPIPVKEGPPTRAGPNASKERAQPAWVIEKDIHNISTYQNTISRATTATRPATAPATVQNRNGAEGEFDATSFPTPPFLGTSVYRTSYGWKKDDLQPVIGRPRRKPAFLQGSTYSATYENTVEMMHGQGWLEEQSTKGRKIPHYGNQWKEVVVSRIPDKSNYLTDYGGFGDGIQGKLPEHHLGISSEGTTRHLFKGTSKSFKRMPGYCGFTPSSDYNAHAIAQATDDHEHPDPKDCRLFTLHQYLLDIPGTATFKPRDAANLVDPPKGRVGTATGFANAYMDNPGNVAELARKRALEKQFGTMQGTRTFFQSGDVCQSDNGVKNAESFFRLLRPYEGLPRVSRPSKTAESGYRFGCYSENL